jgi:histidyl-tRNA synthetase
MGVERLLALMEGAGTTLADTPSDAYIIRVGQKAEGFGAQLAEQLRDAGLHVSLHCGGGSFKSQMKKADASGARFALIVGDDEAATGRVAIKPLRGGGEQQSLAPAEAIACLRAGSAGSDPSGA